MRDLDCRQRAMIENYVTVKTTFCNFETGSCTATTTNAAAAAAAAAADAADDAATDAAANAAANAAAAASTKAKRLLLNHISVAQHTPNVKNKIIFLMPIKRLGYDS